MSTHGAECYITKEGEGECFWYKFWFRISDVLLSGTSVGYTCEFVQMEQKNRITWMMIILL